MDKGEYEIDTKLIFDNYLDKEKGAINKPIFQTTSFEYDTAEELEKVFKNKNRVMYIVELIILPIMLLKEKLTDWKRG